MDDHALNLLIVFTNGTKKVINDISDYYILTAPDCFAVVKNNSKIFIPMRNVRYIGMEDNFI